MNPNQEDGQDMGTELDETSASAIVHAAKRKKEARAKARAERLRTREPVGAKCLECGEEWTVAYLPIDLMLLAKILSGVHCPNCGAGPKRLVCREAEHRT